MSVRLKVRRAVLTSASLVLASVLVAAARPATAAQPCCAAHAFEAEGVQVQLAEVKRTDSDTITVTWTYRNGTATPKQLAKGGKGWSDGYRLSLDAYVVDVPRKIQYQAIRDAENHPVAAKHTPASPTKGLWLDGNKTLSTWAKFMVPSTVTAVSVFIAGTQPWDNVPITAAKP